MQRARRALLGGAAVLLTFPAAIGTAVADDDDEDDAVEVEVIVEDLDSPRGLTLDRRENLWIAQAGRGGTGPCTTGPTGPVCLGATGKISVLHDPDDDDRELHDVVTGLASLGVEGTGEEAIGPSDVAFQRGNRLLATIGLGADPAFRTAAPPAGVGPSALASQLGTVIQVNVRSGAVTPFADIAAFEDASNPDGTDEDSNPNSIAVHHAHRFVADAGGNAVLSVDRDGEVTTAFAVPPEAPVPNPFDPTAPAIAADAVPNTLVRGPDGAFYLGQLTGFPFTPGTATVWRFEKGEAPTVYADGFTNIIDLAFDDDGNLLVLEIAHNGLLAAFGPAGDWTGALIRVDEDDTSEHTVLLEAPLFAPGGIAVDDDVAYISNRSIFPGEGEILKVELDD